MMMPRRTFLITAGAATLTVMLPSDVFEIAKSTSSVSARVQWGMVVDIEKCTECMEELIARTGNKKAKPPCVIACDRENNVPEFEDERIDPQWMRMLKVRGMEPENAKEYYIPLLCNHCENPPCVQVCLTGASFRRADGIVLIDLHRCIGCRYCMVACPYGARSFNWEDPRKHLSEINPKVTPRTKGVVEKCTFCHHRIDEYIARGEDPVPACVEACHKHGKGSLVFGNIKDPNSKISNVLRENIAIQLRANLGTNPHVYYIIKG